MDKEVEITLAPNAAREYELDNEIYRRESGYDTEATLSTPADFLKVRPRYVEGLGGGLEPIADGRLPVDDGPTPDTQAAGDRRGSPTPDYVTYRRDSRLQLQNHALRAEMTKRGLSADSATATR